MGFGHGQGGTHLTVDDGLQPADFLIVPGDLLQHHHVAVIGRRAIKYRGPEQRSIHLFVASRHGDSAESLPTPLPGHLRAPQPLLPGFDAQGLQHRIADILAFAPGVGIGFQRQNMAGDEIPDAEPKIINIGGEGKIHGLGQNSG